MQALDGTALVEALRTRIKTNRLVAWVSAAMMVLAVALFVFSFYLPAGWIESNESMPEVLRSLAVFLFGPAVIVLAWELVVRRSFKKELLLELGLAESILDHGLAYVSLFGGAPWDGLIGGATKMDVFVAWANTWRGGHRDAIRDFLKRPHTELRVMLPDPEDGQLMEALAHRFTMSADSIRTEIGRALLDFAKLKRETGVARNRLRVHFHSRMPTFSYYRFDDTVLLCLYTHVPGKTQRLPTFWFLRKSGDHTFFDWVMSETNYILTSGSRRANLMLVDSDGSVEDALKSVSKEGAAEGEPRGPSSGEQGDADV